MVKRVKRVWSFFFVRVRRVSVTYPFLPLSFFFWYGKKVGTAFSFYFERVKGLAVLGVGPAVSGEGVRGKNRGRGKGTSKGVFLFWVKVGAKSMVRGRGRGRGWGWSMVRGTRGGVCGL